MNKRQRKKKMDKWMRYESSFMVTLLPGESMDLKALVNKIMADPRWKPSEGVTFQIREDE